MDERAEVNQNQPGEYLQQQIADREEADGLRALMDRVESLLNQLTATDTSLLNNSNVGALRTHLDTLQEHLQAQWVEIDQRKAQQEQDQSDKEHQEAQSTFNTNRDRLSGLLQVPLANFPAGAEQLLKSAKDVLGIIEAVHKSQTKLPYSNLIELSACMQEMSDCLDHYKEHETIDPTDVDKLKARLQKLPKSAPWSAESKKALAIFLAIAATLAFLGIIAMAGMLAAASHGAASPLSAGMIIAGGTWFGATLTTLGFSSGAALTATFGTAAAWASSIPILGGIMSGQALLGVGAGAAGLTGLISYGSYVALSKHRDARLIVQNSIPKTAAECNALLKASKDGYGVIVIPASGEKLPQYFVIKKDTAPRKLSDELDQDIIQQLQQLENTQLDTNRQVAMNQPEEQLIAQTIARAFPRAGSLRPTEMFMAQLGRINKSSAATQDIGANGSEQPLIVPGAEEDDDDDDGESLDL